MNDKDELDSRIASLLSSGNYLIEEQPEGGYLLTGMDMNGTEQEFWIKDDKFICMHLAWVTDVADIPGPTPDSPDTLKSFAWCNTCSKDVSDDVGYYDLSEEG